MFDHLLNHRLLTHEEEIALGQRVQAGDNDALDELVRHNLRLVYKFARRYYTPDPGTEVDDLVQEGMLGLLTAARKYDPDRGTRFSTYATYWVRQAIQRRAITAGTIRRSATPDKPRVTPAAIRGHALRQSPIARLDATLPGRKGADNNDTLADIIADEAISVEEQVLTNIEVERIITCLRLNTRGEAIVRDWLTSDTRHEVQEKHGVSRSWLYTMLRSKSKNFQEEYMTRIKSTTCIEEGCDQPKYVNASGIKHARCHEHQKLFWAEAARARAAASRHPEAAPTGHKRLNPSPVPTSDSLLYDVERGLPGDEVQPIGQPPQAQSENGCTCPDCIYREVVSLLTVRYPRIAELVQVMQTERSIRDDLGI